MDKQDINWTQATVPEKILSIVNTKPNYNISFHNNGQEVGKLDFNGPKLVFTGDAEESAKVFIDWIARSFHGRLEEERKAERESCAKVCNDLPAPERMSLDNESLWEVATLDCAEAIRNRGNT
jgi:hypothetical protein